MSAHSGHTVPIQSGHPRPPNVSQEGSQLSSSHIPQLFEKTSKKKCTNSDLRRLDELCKGYTEVWVEDAIKEAGNRNLPYLKVGLISEILGDWRKDGKPEPKPVFTPCGKGKCGNGGWIDGNVWIVCKCRQDYENQLEEWKDRWGDSQ